MIIIEGEEEHAFSLRGAGPLKKLAPEEGEDRPFGRKVGFPDLIEEKGVGNLSLCRGERVFHSNLFPVGRKKKYSSHGRGGSAVIPQYRTQEGGGGYYFQETLMGFSIVQLELPIMEKERKKGLPQLSGGERRLCLGLEACIWKKKGRNISSSYPLGGNKVII